MSKTIALINQKGGVGKTTTTINLASALGKLNQKVLIVDIDPQGNATQGIGVDKSKIPTIYQLLVNDGAKTKDYIKKTDFENVSIIGSNQETAEFDINYEGDMSKESILKTKLQEIKDSYDFIFIDCPPSLSLLTTNGITAADGIIVPLQSEFYALEGMTQILHTIQRCKKYYNPDVIIYGILITMYNNNNLDKSVVEDVNQYFGKYIFKTKIRRNVNLAEAPSYGKPIDYYKHDCNGAIDYHNLAMEVLNNGKK
ncbi:MAG: ParA family protein [Mycoplasmatales bacterium]